MKVLMLNGSPRTKGNTFIALEEMKKVFEVEGVEAEIVQVGNKDVRGCIACRRCVELGKCVFDDVVNELAGEFEKAEDILDEDSEKSSRGTKIAEKRIQIPDYAHLLPKEIASFTTNTVYNNENTHLSFTQGGGHGGSHPHLVHEFIRSILEERKPAIDDIMGAYWTDTAICAHESAMNGGEVITIPEKGYKMQNGNRGNLIAQIKIVVPEKLTNEEKEMFKKLKEISKFNPRRV